MESTYEQCLAHELKLSDIAFQFQYPQPVQYKGIRLDCGYRLDLLVESRLIVELLAGVQTGLLINFNATKLKNGIKRFVL